MLASCEVAAHVDGGGFFKDSIVSFFFANVDFIVCDGWMKISASVLGFWPAIYAVAWTKE